MRQRMSKRMRRRETHMPDSKPRLRPMPAWDCGWRYEWWMCHGHGIKAFGKTPEEAYASWNNGTKAIRQTANPRT